MKLEIDDEEKEFLERICSRAKIFCEMNIFSPNGAFAEFDKDLAKIINLIKKLQELDKKDE